MLRQASEEIRFVPAMALGGAVSLALFLLMHQLVGVTGAPGSSLPAPGELGMVRLEPAPPRVTRREHLPARPRKASPPRRVAAPLASHRAVSPSDLPADLVLGPGRVEGPGFRAGPVGAPAARGNSGPMARFLVKPVYPPAAELQGVQGTVRVCYRVTSTGRVAAARIVAASSPAARRTFSGAALRAAQEWRYVPALAHGRPVATPGVCQTIRFRLGAAGVD